MMEPSSLNEKVVEVFHVLKEDLSNVRSGFLSLQLKEGRVIAFVLRPLTEQYQRDQSGLNSAHQQIFCLLTVDLMKRRVDWVNGEVVLVFELQEKILRVLARFKSY